MDDFANCFEKLSLYTPQKRAKQDSVYLQLCEDKDSMPQGSSAFIDGRNSKKTDSVKSNPISSGDSTDAVLSKGSPVLSMVERVKNSGDDSTTHNLPPQAFLANRNDLNIEKQVEDQNSDVTDTANMFANLHVSNDINVNKLVQDNKKNSNFQSSSSIKGLKNEDNLLSDIDSNTAANNFSSVDIVTLDSNGLSLPCYNDDHSQFDNQLALPYPVESENNIAISQLNTSLPTSVQSSTADYLKKESTLVSSENGSTVSPIESNDLNAGTNPNNLPMLANKTRNHAKAEISEPKPKMGSYALNYDDPNFDPFISKTSVLNSPTEDKTSFMKIPSNQNQQVEENTGRVTPVEPTIESEAALPNTDLKVDNDKSSTVKVDENDDHNLQANSSPKPKQKKKTKKNVIQEIQEENEQVIPKGSYSMDFSKFDDPNFDPFKSNKTLSNEDASETSLPQHASYAVDFDDPNFDPFKSKKSVMNSPTRKETGFMKIPSNQNQQVEENTGRVTPVEPTY